MANEEDKAKPSFPDELSDLDSLASSDSDGEDGDGVGGGGGGGGRVAKGADESVEWLVTSRAKRSTAGNRMKSMLANEEPAAEDSDLELLFAEDEDDAGFTDDANDDSDVQMDSSSDEEDGPNNPDDLEGEKELERQAREKKTASRKRKTQEAIPVKFRKKVRIEPPAGATPSTAESVASPQSAVTPRPSRPKKKSERASWLPSPADMPVRASERSTTRISKQQLHQKMVTDEIRRKKQLERMEKKAKLLEALKKPPMTQAERLAEAALVEKRNAKSLNRWEEAEKQREEERMRKIAALNNRKLDGPVVTFWTGIQELTEAQSSHVGNLVSMEVKAPRKKRQSAAAALAAKEAAANGEPGTPTTPLTPVDKDTESMKTDGHAIDAAGQAPEVKAEKTEGAAAEIVPAVCAPSAEGVTTSVPSNNPAAAPPPPPSGSLTATPAVTVPLASASASVSPAPIPTSALSAALAPVPPRPASTLASSDLIPPRPAPTLSLAAPTPPVLVSPVSVPVVTAPPIPTPLATAPPSMAPPPIPLPPDTRPSNSGVLAAPILAPPAGSPMPRAQMPMLGFSTANGKFNGLAPPNTSHTPSPLSMPASIPAAATPVKPKPTLITSTPASRAAAIPLPPLSNTPMTPATPITPAQSARKKSLVPPTPTTLPPDTPQDGHRSATEPPREGGKVTRSCIILQNFNETAIKDKQVQTQILFGRKMTRLAKPAQPPICVITGHLAKYRDPKTGLHYYNSYAYREIQRVYRGDYKWSGLIGAYVGRGDYAARGVPDRFRDPSLPGPEKKMPAEPVLVPIEGAEELKKEDGSAEKTSPTADEPRLVPIDAPTEIPKEVSKSEEGAVGPVPDVIPPAVPQTVTATSQEVEI